MRGRHLTVLLGFAALLIVNTNTIRAGENALSRKLDAQARATLLGHVARHGTARVIVRLASASEPSAGLAARKARTRTARERRQAAIQRLQARLLSRFEHRGVRAAKRFKDVPYLALEVDALELDRLAQLPEVTAIFEDRLFRLSLDQSVPQIGADFAWSDGFSGQGQVVAVLDTGVDSAHGALSGKVVAEACFSTTSAAQASTTLCPDGSNPGGADQQTGPGAGINCDGILGCDHGTHVAGIAAGDDTLYPGVAPDANIIAVQIFSRLDDLFACGFFPPCLSAHTSDLIRALEWVHEQRDNFNIASVNMSLGGQAYTSPASCDAAFPALKAAIDNLRVAGIASAIASGNDGFSNAISAPACISSAVSVGAVDGADEVAWFSNSAPFLHTLTPGTTIRSAVPGGGFSNKDGTSMAAPHLAGAIAVLKSADPGASVDEIVSAVVDTGVRVTDPRNGVSVPRVQVEAAAEVLTGVSLANLSLGLAPVLSGLDQPIAITHAGDGSGRLFIALKPGRIVIDDGTGVLATPFLDLAAQTACCDEAGLSGLAFHPDYALNGLFYVMYVDVWGDSVVARYQVSPDPDVAESASATEVLRITPPAGAGVGQSRGGHLAFAADGYLYIATGDGGADGHIVGDAADPASLLGKLLRIDVDVAALFGVPPDNPFLGDSLARDEIWALGLRDPRRFAVDRLTGDIYIADVGELDAEEVNVQSADSPGGENYGWPVMEGSQCAGGGVCEATGLTPPVTEYDHSQGCAVAGGEVYRGSDFPELQGVYLYADRCSGHVWGLIHDGTEWQSARLLETPYAIGAFGEDQAGAMYLTDAISGDVYRVEASDLRLLTRNLPNAVIGAPYTAMLVTTGGEAPLEWSVTAGVLPDGLSLDAATGALSGTPTALGSAQFTVRVQDARLASVSREFGLSVEPPPLEIATAALPDATSGKDYAHTLGASGGTPPYAWTIAGGSLPTGLTLNANGAIEGTAGGPGTFTFTAEVTDNEARTAVRVLTLTVLGPDVPLTLEEMDTARYGNDYGSDQHRTQLVATFEGTGTDLLLGVVGYDIDSSDEISVSLNGVALGHLSTGPNNALNAGDTFLLPALIQVAGENRVLFRQKTPGWTWGVTSLLLSQAVLGVDTDSLADGSVGSAYTQSLIATGGTMPYTWSIASGSLPPGLTLSADGVISGTPVGSGVYTFTIRVTDAFAEVADRILGITVIGTSGTVELPLLVGETDPGAYGHNYGSNQHRAELIATFQATGTALALYVTGYDIDWSDEVSVLLNGVPIGFLSKGPNNALNAGDRLAILAAAQLPGENRVEFRQKISGWTWGVTGLRLVEEEPPLAIQTPPMLPHAQLGVTYDETLTAIGGDLPYVWNLVAGTLPPGLALGLDGGLAGSPSTAGSYVFTVRVSDSQADTDSNVFTITVTGPEVALGVDVTDPGAYGHNFGTHQHRTELVATFAGGSADRVLHVTGYDVDYNDEVGVYLNGSLLGYLGKGSNNALNTGDSFAISATAQTSGENRLRFVQKTPGWTWGVTGLLLAENVLPLEFQTQTLPDGAVAAAYGAILTATGGVPDYSFDVVSGSLPPGLELSAAGVIAGTPTASGAFSFSVRLADASASSVTQALGIVVTGEEIFLTPGVMDGGQYGHNFGTSQHELVLVATFQATGTDLLLSLSGYDIDFANEVSVYFNDNLIGHLGKGPNNALNAGDAFLLPGASQVAGENRIRFEQNTPGWRWGVTELLLEPAG